MTRPRLTTVLSAALASALAFFVLTRSGLAGTLGGAAVASLVYTGASHWAGQGIERVARVWLKRRDAAAKLEGAEATAEAEVTSEAQATPDPATVQSSGAPEALPAARLPLSLGRLARTWGPVALAVVALAVSGYSLITGSPLERVIVQERIVEKPVIQREVVIQKETVTVTVTVPALEGHATTSTVVPPTTTTSTAPSTTTTATAPVTTTTPASPVTTATAPVTTTTLPTPVTTTTAAAPAGN